MRTVVILPLLLLAVACRSAPEPSASVVAQQFYATTIAHKISGAPSESQLAALAPYLSDTLHALLAAARQRNEVEAARAPDEKPSFADGNLFSSLFEGPNAAEVLADSARGALRVATVRLTYTGATPPVSWLDRVVLAKHDDRFVVDDIEYGGQWDFANKGRLRASLESVLSSPP